MLEARKLLRNKLKSRLFFLLACLQSLNKLAQSGHVFNSEEKPIMSSIEQAQSDSINLPLQTITVAFQGERGAFGDEATRLYFGRDGQFKPEPTPYRTFADVFRAVASAEVNYGLAPVENSQAGSINDVYD